MRNARREPISDKIGETGTGPVGAHCSPGKSPVARGLPQVVILSRWSAWRWNSSNVTARRWDSGRVRKGGPPPPPPPHFRLRAEFELPQLLGLCRFSFCLEGLDDARGDSRTSICVGPIAISPHVGNKEDAIAFSHASGGIDAVVGRFRENPTPGESRPCRSHRIVRALPPISGRRGKTSDCAGHG